MERLLNLSDNTPLESVQNFEGDGPSADQSDLLLLARGNIGHTRDRSKVKKSSSCGLRAKLIRAFPERRTLLESRRQTDVEDVVAFKYRNFGMPTCTRQYAGYDCSMCNAKAKTAYCYGSDAGFLCVSGYCLHLVVASSSEVLPNSHLLLFSQFNLSRTCRPFIHKESWSVVESP